MRKIFQVLLAAVLMSVTALTMAASQETDEYYQEEGIIYPNGQNPNAMRRAAQLDAYRALSERVGDLYVKSDSTLKELRDLDDMVNARVERCLRGRIIVSEGFAPDGSYHVVARLPKKGSASIAAAVLDEKVVVEDFPPPKFTSIISVTYTGLIIDCRGKSLPEAIAPSIKSVDGMEVYAYKNVGYQSAVNNGMINYSTSLNSGVERAGTSPLIVKAVSISNKCDVVVSTEDADKILAANQSAHFLKNCAVVLVR